MGLEVKDKLFEFGEFVSSEFDEGGIARVQRVEHRDGIRVRRGWEADS